VSDRPIIDGKEQRWRWWLMRVDPVRCVYRFVQDVERYDTACLFADGAVRAAEGDFIVWDSHEKRPTPYDSRKLRAKFKKENPPPAGTGAGSSGGETSG
jgi:hypothetical protein